MITTPRSRTTGQPAVTPSRFRSARILLTAEAAFQALVAVLAYLDRSNFVTRLTGSFLAPNHRAAVSAYHGALAVHIALAALFLIGALRLARGGLRLRVRLTIPLAITAIGGIAAMTLPVQTWLSPIGVVLAVAALAVFWLPAHR